MMSSNLWEQALSELRSEIDEKNFETWLKTTRFQRFEQDTLHLAVPSALNRSWLTRNFSDRISEVVERLAQRPVGIDIHIAPLGDAVAESSVAPSVQPRTVGLAPAGSGGGPQLLPHLTFGNFVVGESNRFAHAACRAVAEPETEAWNPLLIWGGVGLGKTHLLQAIGHEFVRLSPGARVLYVSSDRFMNAFIQAIQQDKMAEFHATYRRVDLLLLDDVQFLFGKEGTQNEFFHTFNELHSKRKKIVLSSDRPPSEMANIEERLRSRFEWGLIVDVQAPDLETRIAILNQKAQMHGFALPNDVAIFIAERIKTNIRKLEGVLTSLRHHWRLTGEPISMESVRSVLGHFLVGEEPQRVTVERIQQCVCEYFDMSVAELTGKERHRKVTLPRHLAMYLCRLLTDLSYPEIATRFRGRNHTSVLHAFRKIEKELLRDTNLQNLANYLTKKIQESAD
ncbi:chromosomal replication initiator protein DnaA [Candidatus Sumerlaeota bacterium]|nr:chromosomal replication initiator protein DnaA [Candidatus Sumerlaeota bacterium]